MSKTRTCPGCKGRGAGRGSKPYVPGLPCDRCKGEKVVADLGLCAVVANRAFARAMATHVGESADGRHCGHPADRVYDGLALCDSHALAKAVELGAGCPNCAGEISRGMHRGEVIGCALVMTCSSTAAQRALQDVSNKLTESFDKLGTRYINPATGDAYERQDGPLPHPLPASGGGIANARADEVVMGEEDDEEDEEGWRYGDECLTDSERNPNINRDLRSYD